MRFFFLLSAGVLFLLPLTVTGQDAVDNNNDSAAMVPPPEREAWELPAQPDPKISIGKIYDFLLDEKYTPTGDNPVLKQEFRYFLYGAITGSQRAERKGHYYVVYFSNDGPPADLIVRMDFRQLLSRDTVSTLEVPFKNFKGGNKQLFVIAGDMYKTYGDVNSWRISIVKDGKIVAQKRSFVW